MSARDLKGAVEIIHSVDSLVTDADYITVSPYLWDAVVEAESMLDDLLEELNAARARVRAAYKEEHPDGKAS